MERKPLGRKTLERLAKEWDEHIKKGGGRFSLHAKVHTDSLGTERDAIHVVENLGTPKEVTTTILDHEI